MQPPKCSVRRTVHIIRTQASKQVPPSIQNPESLKLNQQRIVLRSYYIEQSARAGDTPTYTTYLANLVASEYDGLYCNLHTALTRTYANMILQQASMTLLEFP